MNPFLSIWLHPKQTARYVIEHKTMVYVLVILVLGYIGSGFSAFMDTKLYPELSYIWILLIVIIFAPIFGTIIMFIMSGIVFLVGKLLKGTGSFWDVFKAASLSCIPTIFLGPLYLLWMFASPESFFYPDESSTVALILSIFIVIIGIWSSVILIAAVAEAHQFSIIRSITTLIIPAILLFISIVGLLVVIAIIFVAFFSAL